ncbi:MAG: putative nicotinate-nucleotide adenylyltransferase [Planctomycetota bacterium]|nr:MAG: putative nicotinate-nucleotide adenylyltransferase [Planctomycetota bacterium]
MTSPAEPNREARVGWLGGSFDPVHAGHLYVARAALEHLDLDRVLFVPAARPPHKLDKRQAPGDDRLALLRLACADEARFQVHDLELRRDGPSYSIDTALALHDELGADAQLFYVIGADTLADLASWYRIQDLARLVTFASVAREGTPLDTSALASVAGDAAAQAARDHLLELPPHPASSTAIREALLAGEHAEHLPPGVFDEIRRRGLYRSGAL